MQGHSCGPVQEAPVFSSCDPCMKAKALMRGDNKAGCLTDLTFCDAVSEDTSHTNLFFKEYR